MTAAPRRSVRPCRSVSPRDDGTYEQGHRHYEQKPDAWSTNRSQDILALLCERLDIKEHRKPLPGCCLDPYRFHPLLCIRASPGQARIG